MKRGILILLFVLLAMSVYAVTYGERIQRFEEFPSERAQREASLLPPPAPLVQGSELSDVQKNVQILNDQISALRTAINNARTEQSLQSNQLVSELAQVKENVEDVEDLKRLRDELPALLEKPGPSPLFLSLLTIINFLLLCVMVGMIWHVHAKHSTAPEKKGHSHKELRDYIGQSLRSGVHIRSIRQNLIQHGWDEDEIDKSIHQMREGEAK